MISYQLAALLLVTLAILTSILAIVCYGRGYERGQLDAYVDSLSDEEKADLIDFVAASDWRKHKRMRQEQAMSGTTETAFRRAH